MSDLWDCVRAEVQETYNDFVRLPPVVWIALSCAALILACTIAFGVNP